MKKLKIAIGVAMFSFVFVVPSVTLASSKYDWKNYFSFGEMASLNNKVTEAVKSKFQNDSDWKEIIGGKNIKNDTITSSKIKNKTITGDDLASNIVIDTTGNILQKGKNGAINAEGELVGQNGLFVSEFADFIDTNYVRLPSSFIGGECTVKNSIGINSQGNVGERIMVCDGAHWIAN